MKYLFIYFKNLNYYYYLNIDNSPRNILDILPDRDTGVEEENYGHIGQDNSISSRDLVSYDEV